MTPDRRGRHKADGAWRWLGGRTQFNAYVFVVVLTIMAIKLDAEFEQYAFFLAMGLLGSSTITAIKDTNMAKLNRRAPAVPDPMPEEVPT